MSLAAIFALRGRLSADPDLSDYFETRYGRNAAHPVGYRRAPSAHDYPSICYVPVQSRRSPNRLGAVDVSLVIGVHEAGITDGVFDGIAALDDIQELIFQALTPLRLDAQFKLSADEVRIVHDLGMRHPFHEHEIQLAILRG